MIRIKYISSILALLAFACFLRAESNKTNESNIVGNLRFLIKDFKVATHRLPESWGEMMEMGYLSKDLVANARDHLDFENRFRFLEKVDPVVITNRNEKIILMAITPGLGGNRPSVPDEVAVEGRWLIVELPTGEIEARNYPETALENLFKNAGFNLAAYTGFGGKWAPKKEIENNGIDAEGISTDHRNFPETAASDVPVRRNSSLDSSGKYQSRTTGSWFERNRIMLSGLCLLLSLILLTRIWNRRP